MNQVKKKNSFAVVHQRTHWNCPNVIPLFFFHSQVNGNKFFHTIDISLYNLYLILALPFIKALYFFLLFDSKFELEFLQKWTKNDSITSLDRCFFLSIQTTFWCDESCLSECYHFRPSMIEYGVYRRNGIRKNIREKIRRKTSRKSGI